MRDLKKFFIELLFPISCSGCGIDSAYQLCDLCYEKLLRSNCIKCQNSYDGFCARCASEIGATGFLVLAPYSLIRPWIYSYKLDLNSKIDLINPKLLDLFFINLEKVINKPFSVELVPSENKENWIRNILPDTIKNRTKDSVLSRVKGHVGQKYLNREERNSRRSSLFEVMPYVSIKTDAVLLIDDVMTTGTSLECCISLLLGLGYTEVYVVVFAYQSVLS